MDKFLKYFENKEFVRWVLKPTRELDEFWDNYLENNALEKEHMEFARLLILKLRAQKETYSETQTIEIFSEIVKKLEREKRRKKIRKITLAGLKYAAIALLFFSLGITFYYYQHPKNSLREWETNITTGDDQFAQLTLSDGEKVSISEKESEIEYRKDGQIVINKKDTIRADSIFPKQKLNHLFVPFGKNSSIKLPDGTLAFLNAGSQLDYPASFKGKKREVALIGEAYFEVAHNAEKPFIVKTHGLQVEVLGTKFDLAAYPTDKIIETVLVEGKVKLVKSGLGFLRKDYFLEPNQMAVYNWENDETKISNVDVSNYTSWHEGYLNFETLEMNRVVKKLERYYNIRIYFSDPLLGIRTITGKLKLKEEPERVLNVLAKTASVELIKINQSKYVLK